MYFVDFFKRITKKNNIPILIYLILNVQIITGIIAYIAEVCFGSNSVSYFKIYLTSIALYAFSLRAVSISKKNRIARFPRRPRADGRRRLG